MKAKLGFFLIYFLIFVAAKEVAAATVVVVGGWSRTGTTEEIRRQLDPMVKFLQEAKHRVVVVRPSVFLPLTAAAAELYEKLKEEGILREEIVLVGWCWGGLTSRRFAEQYYGEARIKVIVEIASPNDGYRFAPGFIFNPGVAQSKEIPLFIIAGNKSAKKWYLNPENDGTVDLQSVLSLPAKERAVFYLSHLELIESTDVARQVVSWIQ